MDEVGGLGFVGKPNEGDVEGMVLDGFPVENLLVETPGFADLSLGTVAVHSVLKMAFGDGNKNLRG